MQVIDASVKMGKKKRKVVVALVTDEDMEQIKGKGQMMQGDFDRGLFFLGHLDDEDEILSLLKGMNDE